MVVGLALRFSYLDGGKYGRGSQRKIFHRKMKGIWSWSLKNIFYGENKTLLLILRIVDYQPNLPSKRLKGSIASGIGLHIFW